MTISNGRSGSNWLRVSAKSPCPICKHTDWCGVSADGALAKCMRVAAGAFKTKTDKNGAEYYLHRLDGAAAASAPLPPPGGRTLDRADADALHRVYCALLTLLHLSKAHREALQRRGLTDAEIDRRGYRTLPIRGRARMAADLREQFGDALLRVPGFIVKAGEEGRAYVAVAGAAGLVVPIRDIAGRVVALLVRRDEAGDGGKYSYLSSAKYGGPGPGSPVHVPLGVTTSCPLCRLTEGGLKSDVAHALSCLPTIGAAGLAWRPALDALAALGCRTARLALDADALDNAHVARALAAAAEGLTAAGIAVELERWPAPHKGIDDALSAGAAVEVLTGDTARQAIAEIMAEGTAGEPPTEPGPLDRLAEVLADGGAAALFTDRPLLEALARLADENPAAFAARRAALKGTVSLRDLDAALRPFRRRQASERPAVLLAEAGYRVEGGRLCREHATRDGGAALTPLCNFTARITESVVRDDGAERAALFTVAGERADGRALPAVQVPAADFAGMGWVTTAWHGEAVVYAGQGVRDHLRAAVELLSGGRVRRTIYAHTGWRRIGDAWNYLHGTGAIGPDGMVADIVVSLPDPLAGFRLPDPPAAAARAAAVRASLALLHGPAPDRIIFPLVGAVYRAALGDAAGPIDLALHMAGPHAVGKSELAALCQQHYGAGLDARHLPGSWSSTANATEGLAFAAKDALLVVDDYAPRGAAGDRQRLERDADRLLRAQGNRAGRLRMNADGGLRPARPPRGLILSTGEETPPGQSLRGRMLVLEVSPGDVPLTRLTPHQIAAADGLFAHALAGFVHWLAPQYSELCDRLPAERAALRERATTGAGSARTPGVVADLALGLKCFLDFAAAAGVLGAAERGDLARRGWQALQQAAAAQAEQVGAAEPTALFLRLLAAALASGRAHVAGPDGVEPANPGAWGWSAQEYQASNQESYTHWRTPGGSRRVGWVDGADLYLEPEASYAAAQELAREQGDALPVAPRTLRKRLHERGLLAAAGDGGRETLTVRRTLAGQRRAVLHMRATILSAEKPDQPDQSGPHPTENGCFCGQVAGQVASGSAAELTTEPDQNAPENGHWSGWSGFPQGGEGGPASNGNAASPPQPTGGLKSLRAANSPGRASPAGPADGEAAPTPPPWAKLHFQDDHGRQCGREAARLWCWTGAPRWFYVDRHPPPLFPPPDCAAAPAVGPGPESQEAR